jgi:hypothetical protein
VSDTSTASALDRIEQQFQAMTTTPHPLVIDGFAVGNGLSDRPVPLGEVRDLLPRTATHDLKGAVWSVLVRRAQADSDTWGVAAAGMMMRGLRSITTRVSRGVEFRRDDLQSEILLGFYEALYGLDPDAPGELLQLVVVVAGLVLVLPSCQYRPRHPRCSQESASRCSTSRVPPPAPGRPRNRQCRPPPAPSRPGRRRLP